MKMSWPGLLPRSWVGGSRSRHPVATVCIPGLPEGALGRAGEGWEPQVLLLAVLVTCWGMEVG